MLAALYIFSTFFTYITNADSNLVFSDFHQSSKSLTLQSSVEQPGKIHPNSKSATSLSVPEKLHFPHLINDFVLIVPRDGISFNTTQLKVYPHSEKEFSMYIFKYVTSHICIYKRIL